jgi:hypothetical protein
MLRLMPTQESPPSQTLVSLQGMSSLARWTITQVLDEVIVVVSVIATQVRPLLQSLDVSQTPPAAVCSAQVPQSWSAGILQFRD